MKLGVCEKDLPGGLRENLEWIAAQGFDGFQVWKEAIDGSGLDAKGALAAAYDLGLEVSAVGGGPNLVDPKAADDSVEKFRGFLDLAVELGPRIVTAETKRKPDDLSEDDAWKSTVETVSRISEYAEEVEAALAVECSGGCFIRDHDMFLTLAGKVGSAALKVNLDPANILLADRDPIQATRKLARYTVHAHAKDVGRREIEGAGVDTFDVPVGEGLVDYPAWIAALRETGYDGYLTIEMHARGRDRREDIRRSLANLRGFLEEEGSK